MVNRKQDFVIKGGDSLLDLRPRCHAVYDGVMNKADLSNAKLDNGIIKIDKMGRRLSKGDIYKKDETEGKVFDNLKAATTY